MTDVPFFVCSFVSFSHGEWEGMDGDRSVAPGARRKMMDETVIP